ncbi:hypothetical protein ABER99_20130 [Paenibacillus glucanolyticus]|jgi:ribosomal protein L31|uniref:Uncharacterized protein n=1 Tax=Paenibacillus glucanolyticus TaxID=59843 RepID=A0A163GM74_9BACL|nr:hypothetical protein [Paenibacillus glucanolyticus]KZS45041.1 hypothetical protein AWU65_03405 [Paenibacillus glucanolyticus]OMF66721.1 hypothetical protein BK142_29310 [Paenibacillus glucanolyticus]
MRRYDELSDDLKEIARELHPNDFREWSYKTQGVEIAFSTKSGCYDFRKCEDRSCISCGKDVEDEEPFIHVNICKQCHERFLFYTNKLENANY